MCTSATKRSFFSLNGVEGCYVVKGCRVDVLDQVQHTCSYVLEGLNYAQLTWSTFIDFFFIFDVFVNFRTAFFEVCSRLSLIVERFSQLYRGLAGAMTCFCSGV